MLRSSFYSSKIVSILLFILCISHLDAAVSRKAHNINGLLIGDLYQLEAGTVNVNSGGRIEGTWFLPGTPNLVLQGGTLGSGSITQGTGDSEPSGYIIRLNHNSYVEAMTNRTLLTGLPSAGPALPSSGTRWVNINNTNDSLGDPATIKGLNINAANVEVSLPGGAYQQISVNGNSTLVLGEVGTSEPIEYDIGRLNLNSNSRLEVVGPVLIRMKNQFNPNAFAGNVEHPEWLRIELASAGMNVNSNASVYAVIIAPSKSVHINGLLEGALFADKITINSNGLYRERVSLDPPTDVNQAPVADAASFDLPEDNSLQTFLTGSDPDGDSLTFSILTAPVNGVATLSADGQLDYTPEEDFFGSDSLVFQVSDGAGTSSPAMVQLNILPVNDLPTVLIQPFSVLEDTPTLLDIDIEDIDSTRPRGQMRFY